MAITVLKGRKLGDQVAGGSEVRGSLAGPASYATGGFAADIEADLGVAAADMDYCIVSATGGYIGEFDGGNDKVIAYASGGTEVSATTNLSGETFYLTVKVKNTTA